MAEEGVKGQGGREEEGMYQRAMPYIITLSLLIAAGEASAEDYTTRSYNLPGHGSIELQVPQTWRDELRQPADGHPPTIIFTPQSGASFQVLVTPVYSMRQGVTMPQPADIRAKVKRSAVSARGQAVEKHIEVRELQGPSATGYYFSATDRAAKAGEYRYMTQGMLRVGKVAPVFTVLTEEKGNKAVAESLTMLRSARHLSKAP